MGRSTPGAARDRLDPLVAHRRAAHAIGIGGTVASIRECRDFLTRLLETADA
jgi:hypothetical protein